VKRVGFIIGRQLRQIRILHPDRITGGDFDQMRFGWIAEAVNRRSDFGLRYELYRPWRRYDALVFVKAMGPQERRLRDRLRGQGARVIFDANVNYYERQGSFYYEGMAPDEEQTRDAVEMTRACDAVIADSRHIAERCEPLNRRVRWIPDNVKTELVPSAIVPASRPAGRLELLWCGQAVKLFELLAIEETLRKFKDRIRLVLVTNSLVALDAWHPEVRQRFDRMTGSVEHEFLPYRSVSELLALYASRPGICISPRFLDNSYNLGHTEWKITLAMACGRIALAGAVPSYRDLAERARGKGVWICEDTTAWDGALERLLTGDVPWAEESAAARQVVQKFYSTEKVAPDHAGFVREVLNSRD
jgi:glycosyltransferase involved in cell wall biosynthesis